MIKLPHQTDAAHYPQVGAYFEHAFDQLISQNHQNWNNQGLLTACLLTPYV